MKRFMLMHIGFERPTPEIMDDWHKWFASIEDKQVEQGGFGGGREVSSNGSRDLAWDRDSLTGYNVITAESMDAAEEIARTNPFVSSIRIYELR